ncbi:MAG: DUF3616 domain-containing protein [Bryobacterales bacterium]|nr:DUF3616 domain-containing protein [Bryobacterales bacterium]
MLIVKLTLGIMVIGVANAEVTFRGMCDASAAIWIGKQLLIVNDEDQEKTLLRLYDPSAGGDPISEFTLPITNLLFDPKEPELDLEAITEINGTYWAIGSHSRNKAGIARWSRQNLIAFSWTASGPANVNSITTLLPALGVRARAANKDLKDIDDRKDPKDGGLSIEGLAATPQGDLLIGLRSPLDPGGKALVARLLRPSEVLKSNRALPNLDRVFLLDLDGAGVRDMIYDASNKRYLVLSGPQGPGGPFKIWAWTGEDAAPKMLKDVTSLIPENTGPEVLVPVKDGAGYWLFLDEGARPAADGKDCKDLKDSKKQTFRGIRISDLP